MSEEQKHQIQVIAAEVARKVVFWHEIRFTIFGLITFVFYWLHQTGRI